MQEHISPGSEGPKKPIYTGEGMVEDPITGEIITKEELAARTKVRLGNPESWREQP